MLCEDIRELSHGCSEWNKESPHYLDTSQHVDVCHQTFIEILLTLY
jgi:hypothetical protein